MLNKKKPCVYKIGKNWHHTFDFMMWSNHLGLHYLPFLFGGALMCQVSGVLFLNCPLNEYTCIFLQFSTVLGPNLMFSAILVKTRKIYKIFTTSLMEGRNSIMDFENCLSCHKCPGLEDRLRNMFHEHSKFWQYLFVIFLISAQIIMLCGWSIFYIDRWS